MLVRGFIILPQLVFGPLPLLCLLAPITSGAAALGSKGLMLLGVREIQVTSAKHLRTTRLYLVNHRGRAIS